MAPIASCLDPDALVRLLESAAVPMAVIFELHGCRIEVDADGEVVASRIEAAEGRGTQDWGVIDRGADDR